MIKSDNSRDENSDAKADENSLLRHTLLALSAAAFGTGISLRITDPILPRLAHDYAISLGDAALVSTTFALGYGLSQLLFGPLGDRYGKFRVISLATICCAVATAACALAPDFRWLVATRLVAGAMCAAVIPLSIAWIGDAIPYAGRQTALARFLVGQILGISAGQFIGGLIADYSNWRVGFAGIALYYLLIAWVLRHVYQRLPMAMRATMPPDANAHGKAVHPVLHALNEFSLVLNNKWSRSVLIAVFCEGAFIFGAFAFLVTHLHIVYQRTLTVGGLVAMLFGVGGLMFAYGVEKLINRFTQIRLVQIGGVFIMLGFLLLGLPIGWPWAIPGTVIIGLGFYMLHTTLQTHATQMASERRGATIALFAASFFLGQSAGVALVGSVVERTGTPSAFIGAAFGSFLVAFMFAHRLRQHR